MASLIHLCRKDYSFAKHSLLGSWVVFIVAALMPRFLTGALADAAAAILGPLLAVQYFQVFASVLKILRADSYSGGNAFIGTRPVTMTMLWLSKLVAIAAFVLLPYLLAQIIGVWAMRVHLTPADWLLFIAEKTLLFGLSASIALIVGTHTRHFVWTTLLTIAFGALVLWLSASIFGRSGGLNFIMEARQLKTSQWLVAQVLISIAAILLAWLWIAHRRMSWSIGAGLFALAATAGISMIWNMNFVERLAFPKAATENDLHITWHGEPHIASSTRNGVPFTLIFRKTLIEEVPDGWLAYPSGVRSIARFRDGSVVAGEATNSRSYGDYIWFLLPTLDVELPLKDPSHHVFEVGTAWFEAATSLLRDRTDPSATISGECMVELSQPVILANLPAHSGVSASHGRFRYRIERVEAASGGISLKMAVSGIDLACRGDMRNRQEDIEILIINPKTGKHTQIGSMSGGSSAGFGWLTMRRSLSIDDGPPGPDKQIADPHAFLKDARIYLIGRHHGGTVRVPFEMKDIELKPGR